MMSMISLGYCLFGLLLNLKIIPIQFGLYILIAMNFKWAGACLAILLFHWPEATIFGAIHLVFEALFVAGLGYLEFFNRSSIETGENR